MMKRPRWFLLLFALFGVMATATVAQDNAADPTPTYWAYDTLIGNLLSFTLDGESTWLTQIQDTARTQIAWRVSPARGFVIINPDEGDSQLYRLSPDSAERAALDLPGTLGGVYPFVFNDSVTVLLNVQPHSVGGVFASSMLVLDNESLSSRLVPNLHHRSAAFSRDGDKLRYVRLDVQDEGTDAVSVLAELDLATGEEHDVFTFPANTTTARPGAYGEYFLFLTADRETRQNAASVVDLGGVVQLISEYTPDSRVIQIPAMIEGTNEYVLYDPRCSENCPLNAGTFDNDETYSFITPVIDARITPLHLTVNGLRDAELALLSGDTLSLLKTDGTRLDLGIWHATYGATFDSILSPDGRYLLAYQTEENAPDFSYRVWDLEDERVVMESAEPDNFGIILVNFTQPERGLLLSERGQLFRVYRDGAVTDLPVVPGGFYYGLLPDGGVLFVQNRPDGEMARGSYRYDLDTGEYTLLIADAAALNLYEG